MKKSNYEIDDIVVYQGEEKEIKIRKKDFATGKVSYRLKTGELVSEDDLQPVSKAKEDKPVSKAKEDKPIDAAPTEIENIRKKYEDAIGKPVTNFKKNDGTWMLAKIEEKLSADKYAVLSALTKEELVTLIQEQELGIDVENLETKEEILDALVLELKISTIK